MCYTKRSFLNWWKGKPSGSIACTRKQQPRFYWSRSSVEMNDATPLTPPSAWMNGTPFSNVNNIHVHFMIPEDQKNMTTHWCSMGRLFTAATQALNTSYDYMYVCRIKKHFVWLLCRQVIEKTRVNISCGTNLSRNLNDRKPSWE